MAVERPPSTPLKFALFVTRPVKEWAIAALCAVVIAKSLTGGLILLLEKIIDAAHAAVNGEASFEHAWWLGALYVGTLLVTHGFWRTSGLCGQRWITQAEAKAYNSLFQYLTDHSLAYFHSRFAGSLTSKLTHAAQGIRRMFQALTWQFMTVVMELCVALFIAATISWVLVLSTLCFIAILVGLNVYLVRKKYPLAYEAAASGSRMRGTITDSITNAAAIQETANEPFERAYIGKRVDQYRAASLTSWFYSEWMLIINNILSVLFFAVMLGGVLWLLQQGVASVGSVAAIILVVMRLERTLMFIGNDMTKFMDDYGEVREGLKEILTPHAITDAPDAQPLQVSEGRVQFDAIRFRYSDQNADVFADFTLDIPGGQKVGLVGLSGAGKTTLMRLLLRQYDVDEGAIRIDGQDIREVTSDSLREAIGVVPQDVTLFHRPLRDNIAYAAKGETVSEERIKEAARRARAHEFIEAFPESYDTLVGERGVKLSGGQRQRIAIARAILKDAPILVLDEATSSLDSESEEAIQKALTELMEGRTVLAIAHRLSTLQAMDRLVVLDAGAIVEDGTHEELLERGGIYAKLWARQVEGFVGE